MPDVQSCGFLIVRDEPTPSFLLMKHSTRWDLPKGHIDAGETKMQCALRELWEETGITSEQIVIDPDFKFKHDYVVRHKRDNKKKEKRLTIFLAQLIKPVTISVTEHESYKWFEWKPPHSIQSETIDPLLAKLAEHWNAQQHQP